MMYRTFTYCFLGFLFFSCGSTTAEENMADTENDTPTVCDCRELVYDQSYNTYYLEDRKKGFSGVCQAYFPNGDVELVKNFKDGKVHGEMTLYYENGQVRSKKSFDMNLQTGDHYAYAEDGTLLFHGRYERGRQTETIVSQPLNR